MLPEIFESAKVGDLVFFTKRGWGTIKGINMDTAHPICIEYDGCEETFMLDGRYAGIDKFPTLFPENMVPQYYLDLCPRPKQKVKKTLEIWANIYPDGKFNVYSSEELANKRASSRRIDCLKLTGEYEVEE